MQTQNKLAKAKEALHKALRALEEAEKEFLSTDLQKFDKNIICKKIAEEGGIVSKDRLKEIAFEVGYDIRGLGGFFHGRNKTLETMPDGMIALTSKGKINANLFAFSPTAMTLPPLIKLSPNSYVSNAIIEGRRDDL